MKRKKWKRKCNGTMIAIQDYVGSECFEARERVTDVAAVDWSRTVTLGTLRLQSREAYTHYLAACELSVWTTINHWKMR